MDQRVDRQGLPSQNWIGTRLFLGNPGRILTKTPLQKKALIELAGGE